MELKRTIIWVFLVFAMVPGIWAFDGWNQHLTPQEFREKQKEFITEKAGLTREEADRFFPLYFELQDKKKELTDKVSKLMQKGRQENLSEAEYEKILKGVIDTRIASEELEKSYMDKFKMIISYQKIYQVRRAEMRFHREILKGIQQQPRQEQKRSGKK